MAQQITQQQKTGIAIFVIFIIVAIIVTVVVVLVANSTVTKKKTKTTNGTISNTNVITRNNIYIVQATVKYSVGNNKYTTTKEVFSSNDMMTAEINAIKLMQTNTDITYNEEDPSQVV